MGYFKKELKLRQDIHLWKRLAGYCALYPGELQNQTAMRGIHEQNRMTKINDHQQYIDLWWKSLKQEFKHNKLPKHKNKVFEQVYFNYIINSKNIIWASYTLFLQAVKHPNLFTTPYSDFDFNFWKVFGKNKLTLSLISFKNKLVSK